MKVYSINSRGRYKCNFCDHNTYKTINGVNTHANNIHSHAIELAKKDEEIQRLNIKPQVIYKDKIVYREAPKPEAIKCWYGPIAVFCTSCKIVNRNPGIPIGQTIENTPHTCGNITLLAVSRIT